MNILTLFKILFIYLKNFIFNTHKLLLVKKIDFLFFTLFYHIPNQLYNKMMNNLEARVDMLEKKLAAANINTPPEPIPTKKGGKKEPKEKADKHEKEVKEKKTKVSGYILFQKANRADIVKQMTDANNGEKPNNQLVMSEIAKHWRELSDEDKQPYIDQANQIKTAATE
mgnify:CR=1 FL=1